MANEKIADGLSSGDDTAAQSAFISMLVYSVSTAATLTKGDLPIDIIKPDGNAEKMRLNNSAQ